MLGTDLQATAVDFFLQETVLPPGPGPCLSKLSQGGAELVGECCQDAWKTKAWRGIEEFFRLGSHLCAVEFFPQEKVLPHVPGPSSSQLSQAGALPADSRAEVLTAELERYRATMGEWAAGAEARTQEQAALQPERDQVVGQLEELVSRLLFLSFPPRGSSTSEPSSRGRPTLSSSRLPNARNLPFVRLSNLVITNARNLPH